MKVRESGSVLIEAMVAGAMVAIMLGVMYRSIGDSAMRDRVLAEKRMALLIAQSEMDSVGSILPVVPGSAGGTQDGFAWRVDIQPYDGSQEPSSAGPLYQVTVSVRATGEKSAAVTLKSLAVRTES